MINPQRQEGYVAAPTGGIDAFDLATGRLLWNAPGDGHPLVVSGDRLVAQAPDTARSLRIAVLDLGRAGKKVGESDPVVFPAWVSVGPAVGRSFTAEGRVDKGDLLLKWEARAWYAAGIPGSPEAVRAAKKEASGVARVRLNTGRVEMLAPGAVPEPPARPIPEELQEVKSSFYALPASLGTMAEEKPAVVGNQLVAFAIERGDPPPTLNRLVTSREMQKRLLLKRWDLDTGKPEPQVELLQAVAFHVILLAEDGYVLASPSGPEEFFPPNDYIYRVYSLKTGDRVGQAPILPDMEAVSIAAPRLYCIRSGHMLPGPGGDFTIPQWLRVLDLGTGKLLWERAIRGRRFPRPPV